VRLSYANSNNILEIVDKNDYYPFGMNFLDSNNNSNFGQSAYQNYKYNGKELQEFGAYDYGARFYMPDIGRWGVIDQLSDITLDSYGYVWNNPIKYIDPTGMEGEAASDDGGGSGGGTAGENDSSQAEEVIGDGLFGGMRRDLFGGERSYLATCPNCPNTPEFQPLIDDPDTEYYYDSSTNTASEVTNIQEVVITGQKKENGNFFSDNWWVGPTLVGLGQPIDYLKPVGALGSPKGSSIASWTLSKAIPIESSTFKKTTEKTLTKVVGKKLAKKTASKVVGRVLGRLVPGVGWVWTAYDIWDNREEIAEFISEVQETNAEHAYRSDGSWNTEWHICFAEGTLVYSKESLVPIEKINIGDSVYSYNLDAEKVELSKVINVLKQQTNGIYELSAAKEKVLVTAEHPFYVEGKGWVTVKDLKPNDKLRTSTGEQVKVDTVKMMDKKIEVYNIEVDGNHNYFVTSSFILVHNKNITEAKGTPDTKEKLKQNE
jgi:RHS repeat-associated protein